MAHSTHLSASGCASLSRWERRGLIVLAILALLFGLIVEKRSAFMQRRMTDLGVYLRAGWAVRSGADLYDVTDDNQWHYQYPPLFAILMVPLADAPAGFDRSGMLPFAASAAVWYIASVLCLLFGVHQLANALEQRSILRGLDRPAPGSRRWWALRVLPVAACITPIGHSLMRGQVNLLLLALLCSMAASLVRGQRGRAGLWLSAAICLKVIPAFLVLIPLWRRDGRCLAGCTLGLAVGLGVIPAAVFGVPQTIRYYQEYDEKLLRPAMGTGTDQSRAKELIEMTANDSQSILAAIHNTLHGDRLTRPPYPSDAVRWAQRLLCGAMTLLTLAAAGWRRPLGATGTVLFFGAVVLTMLLSSPVCHLHYFCLSVPLVMALLAGTWERNAQLGAGLGLKLLLVANVIANALPNLPGLEVLRDIGLAMYAALALWATACWSLWRQRRRARSDSMSNAEPTGMAAWPWRGLGQDRPSLPASTG
jgi:hypothetical protein